MPDVFELTIACGARACVDAREERLLDVEPLDDRLDDPVGASRCRREVGVEAAGAHQRARRSGVKNGSGLSAARALRARRARPRAVTSSSSTGTPALARCAAICAPIVPAPSTATRADVHAPCVSDLCRASARADAADEHVDDRVGLGGERVAAAAEDPVGGHLVERAEEHLGGERRVDRRGGTRRRAWPSAMTSRMMPRYSRSCVAENRSMNFVDCRSSTWKTTARSRSRPRRSRCSRAISRSRSIGIGDAGERGAAFGDRLVHRALEDRDEEVVLAAEVEVDGAGGDAGGAGDVGDLGAEEAARGEGVDGGAQDARRACRSCRGGRRRRA